MALRRADLPDVIGGQRGPEVLTAQPNLERAELADVLHDEVLQQLAFARQELLELPGGADALRSLDAAVATLRRLIEPRTDGSAADGGLPLAQAIRDVAAVGAHAGRLRVELDLQPVAWPAEVEDVLRTAARELVANVIKHASATSVEISLAAVGEVAELAVVDDGAGIDLALAAERVRGGHRGLARLRERVLGLGGELDLRCGEDGGTSVTVRLPA